MTHRRAQLHDRGHAEDLRVATAAGPQSSGHTTGVGDDGQPGYGVLPMPGPKAAVARPRINRTAAVILRTDATSIKRRSPRPPSTARAATVQRASSAPGPTDGGAWYRDRK